MDVTEDMKNAGALGWSGHRCKDAMGPGRATDRCWNENEECRCRLAYEGAERGFLAMLKVMSKAERFALATELSR